MEYLSVTLSAKEHKRIFSRISINESSGCWIWNGAKDFQGYGIGFYKGKQERTHRMIYAFFKGPIPRGVLARKHFQLDHLCRNTSCCNPEHLELVSQRTNGLRGNGLQAMNAKKTHCKHGHQLSYTPRGRRDCKTCDSIRHKKRMTGPNREYWLNKANEATKRHYSKKKKTA